jgi:regulator of sigma E protease
MRGMDETASDDPEAMNNKSIPARMLVMAGGSLMNFLLAFVLFFALFMVRGTPVPEIVISDISPNMPAQAAGLQSGDIITYINSTPMEVGGDVVRIINQSEGRPLEIQIIREDTPLTLLITPVEADGRYVIGFSILTRSVFQPMRFTQGIFEAVEMMAMQIAAPFRLLSQLAAGESLPEGEGIVGFIGIGGMVTEAYQITIEYGPSEMIFTMLFFTAVLSSALGIMNLLPIPALDGARLVFLAVEGIRGKPVPPEKEAMVHLVGIVSLLLLAVFIAYRDILQLIN